MISDAIIKVRAARMWCAHGQRRRRRLGGSTSIAARCCHSLRAIFARRPPTPTLSAYSGTPPHSTAAHRCTSAFFITPSFLLSSFSFFVLSFFRSFFLFLLTAELCRDCPADIRNVELFVLSNMYSLFCRYLVEYSLVLRVRHIKSMRETTVPQAQVTTSQWCRQIPVMSRGTTLRWLPPGAEIIDISVFCRTGAGVSPRSNIVKGPITLPPPGPPSKPIMLEVRKTTASTMTLAWMAPLRYGGSPIVDYEISYDAHARLPLPRAASQHRAMAAVGGREWQTASVRVGSARTRITVRGLEGGSSFKNVCVRAISAEGFVGAFVPFLVLFGVHTLLRNFP